MTKREPFAKVLILSPLDDSGQEARALLVGGVEVCHYPFWPSDGEDPAESDSVEINATHDKDVRDAVEEFRERVVEAIFNQPCGMSMYASSREAEAAQQMRDKIQELVEKLPTEPEGK